MRTPSPRSLLRNAAGLCSFAGRLQRRPYFALLAAASVVLIAGTLALRLVLGSTGAALLLMVAVLYWPVTAAGVRRLRDAGQPGHLMLLPLLPILALLGFSLLGLVAARGAFALVYLTALTFGPLINLLILLALLVTIVATLILISATFEKLTLPSKAGERA